LESRRRDRIRARHNQKVGIGAGVDGGAELAEVVAPWGELLPAHMAAAFGVVLVLEEQPLGAGADERACGLDDVKSISKARIGVDEERNRQARGDGPGGV